MQPSYEELKMFGVKKEDLTTGKKNEPVVFHKGDRVEVISGDLTKLTGIVIGFQGDEVIVKPDHKDLQVCVVEICSPP